MPITHKDINLLTELAHRQARSDLYAYRQYINGDAFVKCWLHHDICAYLKRFTDDMIEGKRPKIVLSMPPQHGKSTSIIDYVSWMLGKMPDTRVMYCSASDYLCKRANKSMRRLLASDKYISLFGDYSDSTGEYQWNSDIIELNAHRGVFRTATCGGTIVGESLDIGIIDDPIKGRQAANSATIRNTVWDWFTNDFFTRFSDNAGFIAILTRWHIDDPIGRLIEHFGDAVNVIRYPAIAEENDSRRNIGDALFPEMKPIDFLLERKKLMCESGKAAEWEALYQQNPQIVGGELIHSKWFRIVDHLPNMLYKVITVDTAQKERECNDYTVLQLWGKGDDGRAYLMDMCRGRFEAPELKRRAKAFWNKHNVSEHCPLRAMYIEDKSSGTGLIQELKYEAACPVVPVQRTKDKYTRLLDVVSYIESGMVGALSNAQWLNDFLAECEAFTADDSHLHDDQVDCMIDAINILLASNNKVKVWESFI